MVNRKIIIQAVFVIAAITCGSAILQAAPLPDGTKLGVDAGGVPDASGKCSIGSCAGLHFAAGFDIIWSDIAPGNDGGIVVGKKQLSGGQELAPSDNNITPGDINAAWFYFGTYGTFYADHSLNTFSDSSNDGTTVINDLHWAWNGESVSLGGGAVHDYTINLDGAGGGTWSLLYKVNIPGGVFSGIEFGLQIRGSVEIPPVDPTNNVPVANDVHLYAMTGRTTEWQPIFTDDAGDTHVCEITSKASVGVVLLSPDCSVGTYTAAYHEGVDSFSYTVTDQGRLSDTATGNVTIVPSTPNYICEDVTPLSSVTTVGGGQNSSINSTLITTFTGHIMNDSGLTRGGKNLVDICPYTKVYFDSTSTQGSVSCQINAAATASAGFLDIGDKLICTNKPDGNDTDRFSVKAGDWY